MSTRAGFLVGLACCAVAACSGRVVESADGVDGVDAGASSSAGGVSSSGGASSSAGGVSSSGGASSGGKSTGGRELTGCSGGEYSMSVEASVEALRIQYERMTATTREVDGVRELEILGELVDEGGPYAHVQLVVSPYVAEGTYTCSSGAVRITSKQQCCASEFDTRNLPRDECEIVVSGDGGFPVGEAVAGTFEGVLHDENGEELVLLDGTFCARAVR